MTDQLTLLKNLSKINVAYDEKHGDKKHREINRNRSMDFRASYSRSVKILVPKDMVYSINTSDILVSNQEMLDRMFKVAPTVLKNKDFVKLPFNELSIVGDNLTILLDKITPKKILGYTEYGVLTKELFTGHVNVIFRATVFAANGNISPLGMVFGESNGKLYSSFYFTASGMDEIYHSIPKEDKNPLETTAFLSLADILNVLLFMNARNTDFVDVEASKDEIKSVPKHLRPSVVYKVLKITKDKVVYKSLSDAISKLNEESGGSSKKLHLVRGCFHKCKNGIFWWNPHLRGDRKNGVVVKDYELET